MSTATSGTAKTGTQAEVAVAGAVEQLVAATTRFVDTFDRWSKHKAAAAGASVPRLRLLYSVHCHGPQKMADLAGALDVTPRNVTALVDGLEAEGLVRRVAHSTDRRITLVELTCSPERVEAQFGTFQGSMATLFDGLTDDDQGHLLRILGVLQTRIRTEAGFDPVASETLDA
jgi:DNA-binding MarR family transcriptional regulator